MDFENITYNGIEYASGIYDQDKDIITLIDKNGEIKTVSPYKIDPSVMSNKPLLITLMKLSSALAMGNEGKSMVSYTINNIDQSLVGELKPILEQWCKNSKFMHTLSDELGKLGINVASIEYEPASQIQDILNTVNPKKEEDTQKITKPEEVVSKKETLYDYEVEGKVYKEVRRRTDGVCCVAKEENGNIAIYSPYGWGDKNDRVMGELLWNANRSLTYYDINRLEKDKMEFISRLEYATNIAVKPEEIQNLIETTEQWIKDGGVAAKLANEIRQIVSKKKDFTVSPEKMPTMLFLRESEMCRKDILDEIERYEQGQNIGKKFYDLRENKLSKLRTLLDENKGKVDSSKYAIIEQLYNQLVAKSKNAKLNKDRPMPTNDYEYEEMCTRYAKTVQSILDEFGNKQLNVAVKDELEYCVNMLARASKEHTDVSPEVVAKMQTQINNVLEFYEAVQKARKTSPEVEHFKQVYRRLKNADEEYQYNVRRGNLSGEAIEEMQQLLHNAKGALDDVFRYMDREEWVKYSEEFERMDKYYYRQMDAYEQIAAASRSFGF